MTAPVDRVAEIRQRLEAATPGEWVMETQPSDVGGAYITGHITAEAHTYCGNNVQRRDSVTAPASMTRRDAEFIANAPADVAWLLSRLAVVEAERDELRAKVAELDAQVAGLSRLDGGPQDDPTAHTLKHFDGGECQCECRRCRRDDHCVCRDCSGEGHDHSRRALSGTTEGPS